MMSYIYYIWQAAETVLFCCFVVAYIIGEEQITHNLFLCLVLIILMQLQRLLFAVYRILE